MKDIKRKIYDEKVLPNKKEWHQSDEDEEK